ncbi:MAG TPA: T9SS type A sorting domain-containing protein [Candidatus Cloacimonetes bacterium]|nr:T9SS type A sorting domain-containing protein [Candidatus Cloacimonadota bacterium]
MGSAGIDENVEISNPKIILNNYPNPFRNSTTISFSPTENGENAEIEIYNIKGQKVKSLECVNYFDAKATESLSHIIWNGKDENNKPVSSGIYFYKLKSGKSVSTKKMILMR